MEIHKIFKKNILTLYAKRNVIYGTAPKSIYSHTVLNVEKYIGICLESLFSHICNNID